jgi:hypothetical protein
MTDLAGTIALAQRRAAMRESCKDMTCNCCGRDKAKFPVIGVAASGIVPMSFAWCEMCLTVGAEPEIVMHYLRDDVANGDKAALVPDIFNLKTFHAGAYITFGDWWDTVPRPTDARQ